MKLRQVAYPLLTIIIGIIGVHFFDTVLIRDFTAGAPEEQYQWWLYSTFILFVTSILIIPLHLRMNKKNLPRYSFAVFLSLTILCVGLVIAITPFVNEVYFIELPQIGISNILLLSGTLIVALRLKVK